MTKGPMGRTAATVLVAAGLAVGSAGPAMAEGQQGQSMPMKQGGNVKTDWSDSKLDAFAKATAKIAKIRDKWTKKLDNAENPDERQKIMNQYNEAANGAIEDAGLQPKEYNRIHQAAQQNRDFSKKLRKRIQEQQGN